ncbi:MAG: nucleotidyltransferase domain-containing protein [Leptospiraceae bacterium]|nr:nucleotidyltransferase domain-containing protein [Leptospiraceae bacterium]
MYLFGSRSREEEKENSDIDLLVYFPDDVNLLKIAKYKKDFRRLSDLHGNCVRY